MPTASRRKPAPPRLHLPRGTPAQFIPPMKALAVSTPPSGLWRCEIKFDGYRAVAVINSPAVELLSRNENSLASDYPEIVSALTQLKCQNAVLDGEIVVLDEAGRSRFQLLQSRELHQARPPIVYFVFDLLHLNGESLSAKPIEERRMLLEKLVGNPSSVVHLSPVFLTEPADLLAEARHQNLEGIITKRPASRYEADQRSGAWLKCKILAEQEFVIGGYTPPRNSRPGFGALLVGYFDRGRLIYSGKVGTGFDHRLLAQLHADFQKLIVRDCPFANLPMPRKPRFGLGMTSSEMRKVTWLAPKLVAQVRFGEWTNEGLLRQPVFIGLRRDKPAGQVRREAVLGS